MENFYDLLLAVVIDFIIGDPYWFPHPVIYIGKLIGKLEKYFRRKANSEGQLKIFGGIIVIVVCSISFLIPFGILHFLRPYTLIYHIVNVIFLWTCIAARCLHKEGIKVYDSLNKNDLEDARVKLSYIVGRDTKELSEEDVIRADVETISENTSDGIIAPLFYMVLGGAPLAFLYKGVNTMDSMLGYVNEKYRYIGFFPAKVDDVFNYIPARITGILMCISSPIVKGNVLNSLKIMIRDRKNHKSPNCAYPEAATAGALGVRLGGDNVYFGQVMKKPTLGDYNKKLDKKDIIQTVKLMYSSEIIFMIIVGVIYLV